VACFKEDYLHLMTPADAKSVMKLHEYVHGVDGIAGSIDCMHYYWLILFIAMLNPNYHPCRCSRHHSTRL
jgi:hypothetical protein